MQLGIAVRRRIYWLFLAFGVLTHFRSDSGGLYQSWGRVTLRYAVSGGKQRIFGPIGCTRPQVWFDTVPDNSAAPAAKRSCGRLPRNVPRVTFDISQRK